ncbi:MAG: hypothetical protein NTZ78_14625 [Candidatus Aureabacteria bacterium]|nr:hypothetical protein [Candidatus Auribacterota bacterium]
MEREEVAGLLDAKRKDLAAIILDRAAGTPIEAIVVTGDFATGELSVVYENGEPCIISPCRVTVIASEPLYSQSKKELAQKLFISPPDMTLAPALLDIHDLPLLPPSPAAFALKYGGHIIEGNRGILSRIGRIDAGDVPASFPIGLMLESMLILLRHFSPARFGKARGMKESAQIVYYCIEALGKCCDAMLLLKGRIPLGFRERNRLFAKFYPEELLANERLAEALQNRTGIDTLTPVDAEGYWSDIRSLVLSMCVRHFNSFCCYDCGIVGVSVIRSFIANLYGFRGRLIGAGIELLSSGEKGSIDDAVVGELYARLGCPEAAGQPAERWESLRSELLRGIDQPSTGSALDLPPVFSLSCQ